MLAKPARLPVPLTAVTSASSRDYALAAGAVNQTRSYRVLQNITFQACRHAPRPRAAPAVQQLSVDRVFAWYAEDEGVLRFALTSLIGPAGGSAPFLLLGENCL